MIWKSRISMKTSTPQSWSCLGQFYGIKIIQDSRQDGECSHITLFDLFWDPAGIPLGSHLHVISISLQFVIIWYKRNWNMFMKIGLHLKSKRWSCWPHQYNYPPLLFCLTEYFNQWHASRWCIKYYSEFSWCKQ